MYSPSKEENTSEDVFMKDFKFYKQIKEIDKLENSSIIYLDQIDDSNFDQFNLKLIELKKDLKENELHIKNYGFKDLNELRCYEFIDNPGLLIFPNPFRPGYQRFFVKKCLSDYHNLPNKTNLDLHMERNYNLWTNAADKKDFTEFNKLRWTTIGYHYDWTAKVYNENDKNDIPIDVKNLSELIASLIGFANFKPEAGIINYYHLNSTLSAHQDSSEKNMSAPLISFSLGSSAIFLIGGDSKTIKPRSICLKSGDIVIMSGTSRLAFHAVPKIFKDTKIQSYFEYNESDLTNEFISSDFFINDQEWSLFYDYIKINRINLNIRQVNQ